MDQLEDETISGDEEEDGEEDEYSDSESDTSYSESEDGHYNGYYNGYMESIRNILLKNSEVKFTNCLELNKHMQQQLQLVREHLQSLLKSLAKRYQENEKALKSNQRKNTNVLCMRGAYLRGGTFYFKGNLFFRDDRNRCCPNNPDYIRRSIEGEMFPMDFELRSRHVWSVADKVTVVQAIKQQIITYLDDQNTRQVSLSTVKKLKGKVSTHSNTIVQLLASVDDNFVIDWGEISAHDLQSRHSPTSCKAMWNVFLKPSLRRSEWTEDENLRLVEAVQTCNNQDWQRIANLVGNRSDYQCFVQFKTTAYQLMPQTVKRWDADQDKKLLHIVEASKENGLVKWNRVMMHFPNKSRSTLQQRYFNSLNPNVTHAQFTPEEDLVLLAAVEEYGTKFSCFPRTLFPNRTTVQLRCRYRNILENRHKQTAWSVEDDQKLMDFVTEHGISEWNRCAQLLGNHNRTSCRTRFLTIKKFLEQNPTMSVADIPRRKLRKGGSDISTANWLDKVKELRKDRTPENDEGKSESGEKPPLATKSTDASEELTEPTENEEETDLSMRLIEKDFDDYFKYTHNYKIGQDAQLEEPTDETLKQFQEIADILQFRGSQTKPRKRPLLMPKHIRERYSDIFEQLRKIPMAETEPRLLPPSFPLMLGWRTLSIHEMDEDESESEVASEQPSNTEKEHEAVKKFRARFRSMFYNCAVLSQIKSEEETEHVPDSDDVQHMIAESQEELSNDECGNKKQQQQNPDSPNKASKKRRVEE